MLKESQWDMGFEFLVMVAMVITVFWEVMLCCLVNIYINFGSERGAMKVYGEWMNRSTFFLTLVLPGGE
jgi:hypothetical protein